VQDWFVASFCEDRFSQRRHQCANAAMTVYGLSHSRSRELYDLIMLEVRRAMYDNLPRRQPIAAGRLDIELFRTLVADAISLFATLAADALFGCASNDLHPSQSLPIQCLRIFSAAS